MPPALDRPQLHGRVPMTRGEAGELEHRTLERVADNRREQTQVPELPQRDTAERVLELPEVRLQNPSRILEVPAHTGLPLGGPDLPALPGISPRITPELTLPQVDREPLSPGIALPELNRSEFQPLEAPNSIDGAPKAPSTPLVAPSPREFAARHPGVPELPDRSASIPIPPVITQPTESIPLIDPNKLAWRHGVMTHGVFWK